MSTGRTDKGPHNPLVTAGTSSWREGADTEHAVLARFLEDVAATQTIQSVIQRAVALMRPRPGSRVFDLGCGIGVLFPPLAEAVGATGQIFGLDHGVGFLADARQRAVQGGYGDRVQLVRGDAHELPFTSGSFDAAHTERVLMHLRDPDEALRELRRVIRPGGWLVCVEPDLTGMRMDHQDASLATKVIAGFCASIQNPAIGIELNRRMARAGFLNRRVETITEVEGEMPEDAAEFFDRAAATAVERGWLTTGEAAAALAGMQEAHAGGYFTSYSSMFIVAGQVPDTET
jgi:SAM-dependent methyltransferase